MKAGARHAAASARDDFAIASASLADARPYLHFASVAGLIAPPAVVNAQHEVVNAQDEVADARHAAADAQHVAAYARGSVEIASAAVPDAQF